LFIERQGLTFSEALEATRVNNVFTTHTPVPAGIDLFDPGLVYHYFNQYCRDAKIDFNQFMALGRKNPQDGAEPLSMAIFFYVHPILGLLYLSTFVMILSCETYCGVLLGAKIHNENISK